MSSAGNCIFWTFRNDKNTKHAPDTDIVLVKEAFDICLFDFPCGSLLSSIIPGLGHDMLNIRIAFITRAEYSKLGNITPTKARQGCSL